MRRIHLKKCRTGAWTATGNTWHSMSTGASSAGDDDSEDDDSADEETAKGATKSRTTDDPEKARLSAEAKRRRIQAREWKQRAEAAEARLASDGRSTGMNDTARADFILALAEAGLKRDRIRAATKLVDLDEFDDVEDAVDELRAEHPFLFGPEFSDDDRPMGRTAPALNNGRKKLGRETAEQKAASLATRFPALRGRIK